MLKIDTENAKTVRRAMNVICGIETGSNLRPDVTAYNSYDDINGDVYSVPVFVQYMDLSANGFPNDGSARPYEADHAGIIAQASADGASTINLSLKWTGTASSLDRSTPEASIYYFEGNKLKSFKLKYATDVTQFPYVQYPTLTSTRGRIQIARISFGYSWWFDNQGLIACNVALRGIETQLDDPELQISQIEVTGYEPDNVLDKVAMISDNAPIYYTCGYPGDMAPLRKFYLSEQITWADKQIAIKGEDASKFLEKEYAGKYVGAGDGSETGGGLGRYITTVNEMLDNAGINHEYVNEMATGPYADGSEFFINNISKRTIVAQCVNLFRFQNEELGDCYVKYVDAGIPQFTATSSDNTRHWTIADYTNLTIDTERKIKSVEMEITSAEVGTSAEIETVQSFGTTIRELADPYRTVTTSRGTITLITPYKYKLKASGNAVISGRPIKINYDPSGDGYYSPFKIENDTGVEKITLSDFNGMVVGASLGPGILVDFWDAIFENLRKRGIKTYKFTWRGDPRMQPRDYLTIIIDGTPVDMTIESITLDHSDGGLTSQIVAREGFI